MSFDSKISAIRSAIPSILKLAAIEFNSDITVLAQAEMELRDPIGKTRTGKKKYETPIKSRVLGIRRAKEGLNQSFFTKLEGSKLVPNNKKEYAAVHEFGGGNNIPKRPYLRPAMEKYIKGNGANNLEKLIINEFVKAWNNG